MSLKDNQSSKLTFRESTIDDYDQLIELALLSYGQYAAILGADNWALMSNNIKTKFIHVLTKAKTFVCAHNEQIVGMACLMPSGNPDEIYEAGWAHVRMVGVHPDYSGQGICRILMNMCLEYAVQTKEQTLALHTSEFMDAARHIYESIGFKVIRDLPLRFGKRYWLYTLDIN